MIGVIELRCMQVLEFQIDNVNVAYEISWISKYSLNWDETYTMKKTFENMLLELMLSNV